MHLKEHNHSPKYCEHVKSIYPNIRETKEWLNYIMAKLLLFNYSINYNNEK